MLLNWTYVKMLVAGGLGFVTLELLPTVLTGHHWHGLLMAYLTLYEIKHTLYQYQRADQNKGTRKKSGKFHTWGGLDQVIFHT